jgi:arsenite-transporting ATPase
MSIPTEQSLARFLESPTRFLFFTGKGGVGKTSLACASAIALADAGRRVLLVSTDPASNLDEVLGVCLTSMPTGVPTVPRLAALNIDPSSATAAYREKLVGPYRGKLPESILRGMAEQLSGACTMEIAAFDEFSKLLGEPASTADFDYVIFDTAPTGHTLLLLDATESYHREIARKASNLPDEVRRLLPRLRDGDFTRVLVITLPEATPVHEAAALQADLRRAGIEPFAWVINQSFAGSGSHDPLIVARARGEVPFIREVVEKHSKQTAIVPWVTDEPVGHERLQQLFKIHSP